MSWTIRKVDLSVERQITIAAIISTPFLREIRSVFNPAFFQSAHCGLITRWAVEFFSAYNEAPNRHIKNVFDSKKLVGEIPQETVRMISQFLSDLSDEYLDQEHFNYQVVLDQAVLYFRQRALEIHVGTVQGLLDNGDIPNAEIAIHKYLPPLKMVSANVDILTDKDVIMEAFAQEDEDDEEFLFRLPNALGDLIGPLHRDDFLAVAAPMGRGKTWYLQYFAMEALLANLNVAFFSMGDMTVKQMIRRFHRMFSSLPLKPGIYLSPIWDCWKNQSGMCNMEIRTGSGKLGTGDVHVTYEDNPNWVPCAACRGTRKYRPTSWVQPLEYKTHLTWSKATKKGIALRRMLKGKLMLEAWPRKMAGVSDVRSILATWQQYYDFIPDVIITDYADIMKDESRQGEYRHQINSIWEAHDSLAKEMHALVISATQTDRSTFTGKNNVGGSNVSEDIRKLAHVSIMLALNQTDFERRSRLMRVSVLKNRHEECDVEKQAFVLQQLDLGQVHIDSIIA